MIARRDHTMQQQLRRLAEHAEELAHLRGQVAALTERLSESERNREIAEIHERELRLMLTNLQAVQLHRDQRDHGDLGRGAQPVRAERSSGDLLPQAGG